MITFRFRFCYAERNMEADMGHILQDLIAANQTNKYFAMEEDTADKDRDESQGVIREFLERSTKENREEVVLKVARVALSHHAKASKVGSTLPLLQLFEAQEQYPFLEWNRVHMVHQVNTFLLGLLIYDKVDCIRCAINQHVRTASRNRGYELSGGTEKGEFLFRWRIASMFHDIGNLVQLPETDNEQITRNLANVQRATKQSWIGFNGTLESLVPLPDGKNIYELLDDIGGHRGFFERFARCLREIGYKKDSDKPTTIYRDHGLCSAVMVARICYDIYDSNRWEIRVNQERGHGLVTYERNYFYYSLMDAAYAMAMHNLDFYPKSHTDIAPVLPYRLFSQPLAYLLKISDMLQEWHKPMAAQPDQVVDPSQVVLHFNEMGVQVEQCPGKEGLKKTSENNLVPPILFCSDPPGCYPGSRMMQKAANWWTAK